MTPRATRSVARGVAAVWLLAPLVARGDAAIGRRLAALKVLVNPAAARVRVAAQTPSAPANCPDPGWWELTQYGLASRTREAIRDASLRFTVDEELIRSVIRHESAYDPRAVSHKGAMGLMQLMPQTASAMGVRCPFDPRQNVLAGTRYLRRMRDRLGSWPRAVAAYHAGPMRVEAGRVPAETRRYVRRVLASWRPERLRSRRLP